MTPSEGHRVTTTRRMVEGVPTADSGAITRLEDGGYCVVKWDSDGESTSVLMMSLRPEAATPSEAARKAAVVIESELELHPPLSHQRRDKIATIIDTEFAAAIQQERERLWRLAYSTACAGVASDYCLLLLQQLAESEGVTIKDPRPAAAAKVAELAELDAVLEEAQRTDPIGVRLTELALERMDKEEDAKVATEGEKVKVVRSKDIMEALCAVFESVKRQTIPVSEVGALVYKGLIPVPEFYVTVSPATPCEKEQRCGCTDPNPAVCLQGEVDSESASRFCGCGCHVDRG